MAKLTIIALLLAAAVSICAPLQASAQSTEFTFQGSLTAAGQAASGNHDFEFRLYDALTGGSQIGGVLTRSAVPVAAGSFSVSLDFGPQFPGGDRFLEIRVRAVGEANFTILSPRQRVASTPYSVRSLNAAAADSAATASNSVSLGGIPAGQYVVTIDSRLSDARQPLPGSSNYIQNQGAVPQNAGFHITGIAKAFTFTGDIFNAGLINTTELNSGSYNNNAGQRVLGVFGTSNIFAGLGAGAANSDGSGNSFFGSGSGAANTTGESNSFLGEGAGSANIGGARNTFVGRAAGNANTTGTGNSIFGFNADVGGAGLTNATAIGANALVTQNNSLILGSINGVNGSTVDTNVGIGTTAPAHRLHVVGNGLFSGNLTVGGSISGSLNVSSLTGVLGVANGGTGVNSTGASGNFLRSNGTAWVSSPLTAADITGGSANYIQNQNSGPQASSNFNISGNGTAGGTFSGNIVNAATQYNFGGNRILSAAGTNNTFLGLSAGAANPTGGHNTFAGSQAGSSTTSGDGNSFFGTNAGQGTTTGSQNTFVGRDSGETNTTGSGNTALGFNADVGGAALTNATAVGANATVTQSNSLVLGSINGVNGATADANVGIGTTAPTQRLHVVGNGLFTGNLAVGGSISGSINVNSLNGVLGVANGGTGINSAGASGNFLRSNGTSWVSSPLTAADIVGGSTNYIQNQNSGTQASSNFNISGNGTVGGTLSGNIVNAATQFNLGTQRVLSAAGSGNLFVGVGAGAANTTGTSNSYFGSDSGAATTSGSNNAFFGEGAGASNTTGFSNSYFGRSAGNANTTGDSNSFFGNGSGSSNVGGLQNSFFGRNAGNANIGGSGNSVFGFNANVGSANLTNATAIGFGALVTQNNALVLGSINGVNGATADTNVGIGTTAPAHRLHVVGNGLISGNLSVGGSITGALNVSSLTGVLGVANGGTGVNSAGANGNFLRSNGSAWVSGALTAADIVSGSANYIQNQNAGAQASANFNISGSGTLGGSLTAASGNFSGGVAAGSAAVTGNVTAGSASVTGALSSGSAGVAGNLTVDTNTLVVDAANNRVGIGTASPSNTVSLGGENAQTIAMERRTTAGAAGNALTVAAGSAASGAADLAGGDLVLRSGTSTGTAGSNIVFQTSTPSATTGTADNASSTKMQIAGNGSVAIGASPADDTRLTVTRSGAENVDNNALVVTNATTGSNVEVSPTKFTAKFSNTGAVLGNSFGVQVDNLSTNVVKNGLLKYGLRVESTGNFTGDDGAATKNYGLTVNVAGADENYAATFTGGNVGIGTAAPQDALHVNGIVRVATLGAAGATAICQNAQNQIATCSSSLRYKTNVAPYLPGLSLIMRLRPIAFDWKDGGLKDIGFGAEDIAKIDTRFVTFNQNGEVEGIKYDRLSVAFVNAFNEQQRQIEDQKKQLEEQNKKIEAQQKQIDTLIRVLCARESSNSDACQRPPQQ